MTKWYIDIYPCNACNFSSPLKRYCVKEHIITHVDGCKECGRMVNTKWYYFDEKCPDFEEHIYSDPSGS